MRMGNVQKRALANVCTFYIRYIDLDLDLDLHNVLAALLCPDFPWW